MDKRKSEYVLYVCVNCGSHYAIKNGFDGNRCECGSGLKAINYVRVGIDLARKEGR